MKITGYLTNAMKASVSALKAEGERFLIVAQNMANAQALPTTPGGEAYQRKIVSFKTQTNREGVELVVAGKVQRDSRSAPPLYMPEHPGANSAGFVNQPNINPIIEAADARQSNLSYSANLSALQKVINMMQESISLLK